ncbi:MAG: hypothetical protein KGL74_07600 [Elusimicrobia bacterium]|nr:hypothetical protein [Elusimicrobiota bacterium]
MKTRALLAALMLTAAWSRAARRTERPEPAALLERVLSFPSQSCAARVRVQAFGPAGAAGKAKAQTRLVRFRAPAFRRIEVAGRKAGPPALLAVSDGRELLTAWPKAGRGWLGADPPPDAAAERARLESLYELSVSTGGRAARKATWRLDLRSRADGRLRRSYWLSRAGGLILKREDYRPDGTLLRRERAVRLEAPEFSAADFLVRAPDGAKVEASTVPFDEGGAFRAREDFPVRYPRWLPVGFVLLEHPVPDGDGRSVTLVYTDGVTTLTIVERPSGPAPTAGSPYAEVRLSSGSGKLSFAEGATRLDWTRGGRDEFASGDLPEADLARVADSVPEAP